MGEPVGDHKGNNGAIAVGMPSAYMAQWENLTKWYDIKERRNECNCLGRDLEPEKEAEDVGSRGHDSAPGKPAYQRGMQQRERLPGRNGLPAYQRGTPAEGEQRESFVELRRLLGEHGRFGLQNGGEQCESCKQPR